MGIHFYDESPSDRQEQAGRLTPGLALLKRGIPFVVHGEDALSIIHFVPTVLFDQHLLVDDTQLGVAVSAICADLPYHSAARDTNPHWFESPQLHDDEPHAFQLQENTILLELDGSTKDLPPRIPRRIFVHKQSVFHFEIDDPSSTMLNPAPPGLQYRGIRFPTLSGFLDSAVSILMEQPRPFRHSVLGMVLRTWISYLFLYTFPDRGVLIHNEGAKPEERRLTQGTLEILAQLKTENQPFLLRRVLELPRAGSEDEVNEWRDLRKQRLAKAGIQYESQNPMLAPWTQSAFLRNCTRPPPRPKRFTPILSEDLQIQWTVLPRYSAISSTLVY
ncbi:hypothetical protein HMN09_01013800 [Mycena chlorophos]|uniref:Uncharacterized protein n=1 Tax=Mycena chlorophos TaxID=658473 RepID=A0A8H6SFR2_MYCCL|nr:hypothetical protein HMN09_01013800 [Mycena chlorophos]